MTGKLTVTVTAFQPCHRGTLAGFCTVHLAEVRLVIRDIAVHQAASGGRWVSLPARPVLDPDGAVKRTQAGRPEYVATFRFDDRDVTEAFSRAVIRALLEFDPTAFDESAA